MVTTEVQLVPSAKLALQVGLGTKATELTIVHNTCVKTHYSGMLCVCACVCMCVCVCE